VTHIVDEAKRDLDEFRVEDILIETDEICIADTDCRCSHVSCWPEHSLNSVLTYFVFDIELGDLLAFHRN
jgi:hypothetical protein